MNIICRKNKTRIYKTAWNQTIVTGSYEDENGNELLADKFEWLSTIEVDADQLSEAYHEQIIIRNDSLEIDHTWEENLMFPSLIKEKEKAYLQSELDTELALESPDIVKVFRLQNSLQKLPSLTDKETYELALANLETRSEVAKPEIKAKLQSKISQLS